MKRLLFALALLALPVSAWAQINQWTTPPLYEKQIKWGGWTIAAHDTCSLLAAGAEDTTEAIPTLAWSWSGAGNSGTASAQIVAELCIQSSYLTVGGADSLYYSIEQSPDGQTWSRIPHFNGLAQITSGWPLSVIVDGTSVLWTCVPIAAHSSAAWTANGGQWASPFIRIRVQIGSNGNKIAGGKAFIRYLRREGM